MLKDVNCKDLRSAIQINVFHILKSENCPLSHVVPNLGGEAKLNVEMQWIMPCKQTASGLFVHHIY